MSRALGAAVGRSPQAERGWHRITRLDHPAAHHWLGDNAHPVVFQWHGEAFALPDGAILLASSTACPHQAWCLGPHLAMQFHIEVDEHKLAAWAQEIDNSSASAQAHSGPFWQGVAALREGSLQHLPASQRLADRIYSRWLAARVP
jgi:GMP synthase (glutamine-hydrolysing)